MAWVAVGIAVVSVVGTGVSFYAQQQAANAAEDAANYNAKIARDQALQENELAAENARRKQDENNRVIAASRAALAASGLALEGTPLAVLGETSTLLERDILDLGFDAQSRQRQLLAQSNLSLFEGQSQASSLRNSSWGTAISGLSSAAGGYSRATGKTTTKTTSFLG